MKKIPYQYPDPSGTERSKAAKEFRELATEVARLRPQALTRNNGDELDLGPEFTASFTKGLDHDINGVLADKSGEEYSCFVEAINSKDRTLFEKQVTTFEDKVQQCRDKAECCDCHDKSKGAKSKKASSTKKCGFHCKLKSRKEVEWRGWESPRAGHVYELEGPDPGAVGMAPAPKVGSSELAAEMAEVYAMALLRDVPFSAIAQDSSIKLCKKKDKAKLSPQKIVDALNKMLFFKAGSTKLVSSTPEVSYPKELNRFETRRKQARNNNYKPFNKTDLLTLDELFRGSTPGAMTGPYISQFLLAGTNGRQNSAATASSLFPGRNTGFDPNDGFVQFGTQIIDQRVAVHKSCLDYMTDWPSWLDVQNGANFKNLDVFEAERRFITTPRDLATYVHFDKLYQAYLNACFILLNIGDAAPKSEGFPEPSYRKRRTAFVTFGDPHVLSLVTEVATRCLKSVRRQKFNYHRRARPELMGGRLTLARLGRADLLGSGQAVFESMEKEIPEAIKTAIISHNREQNTMGGMRNLTCPRNIFPAGIRSKRKFDASNLLLPMAFPEGSPMHPAYGAGHATVAGGCVTMLKAFFEMFDSSEADGLRRLDLGTGKYYRPNSNGSKLVDANVGKEGLTIQGELDKLAANISIGRNFAGVHYYSDYYDSLRMGERIAVGILMEQAPTYGDEMEMTFNSFDGDLITISGEAGQCPSLSILDSNGNPITPAAWWLRHVPGEELILDL